MFDQLTDYNENDNENEDDNNEEEWKQEQRSDRGEDDESEIYDRGEDGDAIDLHEYRQRIQVLNEDIQSFIMDADGCEEESGAPTVCNDVHNLQLQANQ